ncbi:MAG: aminopeptidase [Planctomycetia bacterium]|nr:aminopeptidase [Planctomycetia bacterium]
MLLDSLASILVGYSAAVRPGEVVSLTGPSSAEPLLLALYREVLHAGGHPLLLLRPEACDDLLQRAGNPAQLAFVDPLQAREVEVADVAIHVLPSSNPEESSAPDPARAALFQRARRPLFERFLARAAERSLRWLATLSPGHEAARAAGLTLAQFETLFARATFLDQPDPRAAWRKQGELQQRLIERLQQCRELRLVEPSGTDLRLGIAGRVWSSGDGHENFPDGEVFVAPLEDATEGTVCFAVPSVIGGQLVEQARLVFRSGRVVEASAARGESQLLAMLDQDAGARVLGEAALGCNYAIDRLTGHPLLDEKVGGTFHLGLGASLPGGGGHNQSTLHWDLIGDLRRGGRVEADGQVMAENGHFIAR